MVMLKVSNLSRKLGEFSLHNISFEVAAGEYFVLLGRSGSGKTQLLEQLAGIGYPDSGKIVMDGTDITRVRPQHRDIGFVFQDFAVFPHMTTYENIAFPLRVRGVAGEEIRRRVNELSEKMNIKPLLGRRTTNLSGGELQRTALARTLVVKPRLLLLDEPLSSIDASLKDEIAGLLRSLNRSGQTIIHVTHDYAEAIGLATSVGVIHNGHIIQAGTPADVFNHPVNRFVARYTGVRNFFRVRFIKKSEGWECITSNGISFALVGDSYPESGLIVVRNNNVHLSLKSEGKNGLNSITGVVREVVPTPAGADIEVTAGERIFVSVSGNDPLLAEIYPGKEVCLTIDPRDLVSLSSHGLHGSD